MSFRAGFRGHVEIKWVSSSAFVSNNFIKMGPVIMALVFLMILYDKGHSLLDQIRGVNCIAFTFGVCE